MNAQMRNVIKRSKGIYTRFSKYKISNSKALQSQNEQQIPANVSVQVIPQKNIINQDEELTPINENVNVMEQTIQPFAQGALQTNEINIVEEKISLSNAVNLAEERASEVDAVNPAEEKISVSNNINPIEQSISAEKTIIIEETILIDKNMNTVETEPAVKSTNIPVEFEYLKSLIDYRLNNPSGENIPRMPAIEDWNLPVKKFIKEHNLANNQNAATLLLIGLAPHADAELFDIAIQEKLKASGDFPEIGGVRGKNFRGFLPTGQTAVFLLAGDSLKRRKEIEQLFWSDKDFAKKKILWLEELSQGEPVMSGKIIMALDYIDMFLFGAAAPPHFSTTFPAKKITTRLTSNDIVMNDEVRKHYKNLRDWIENNPELMRDWDKQERLRKGFRVLFYGPPGTGKTLTANVLGNETGKDVYKIDLSMVVSKYIGETEKNLELLFARAEDKDWILFFDEADAIFGKRTGVRDAHDKYANQEVSYLLQRIEDFNGLVILATNMKNNIDDAFIRRFNDIVKFTIPNENERREIWKKSFPEKSDFNDIPNKVKKYELTGGNIINIIHFASIQAVMKRHEPVNEKKVLFNGNNYSTVDKPADPSKLKFYLEDVIAGIRREMIKEGKPFDA